jgi:hypothetical protein
VERYLDHEIGGVAGTYNLHEHAEQKTYVAYAIENKVCEGDRQEEDSHAAATQGVSPFGRARTTNWRLYNRPEAHDGTSQDRDTGG